MLNVDMECKLLTENDSIDRYSYLYIYIRLVYILVLIDLVGSYKKCKILVCGPTIGVQAHRSIVMSYNEWAFVIEHEAPI